MVDPALQTLLARVYPELPEVAALAFEAAFVPTVIEKRAHLLKEGDATHHLFFIRSGLFRGYVVKDIDELTTNFYFGPTFYADVPAITRRQPVRIAVQALERSEVWTADMAALEAIGAEHPSVLMLFLRFYEIIYSFGVDRQLASLYDSAEERYEKLFSERPKVVQQIPLVYIASYLGIKPESLSRIRARMAHRS